MNHWGRRGWSTSSSIALRHGYLMWGQTVWVEARHTVDGLCLHTRVDQPRRLLPSSEAIHAVNVVCRSLTLKRLD